MVKITLQNIKKLEYWSVQSSDLSRNKNGWNVHVKKRPLINKLNQLKVAFQEERERMGYGFTGLLIGSMILLLFLNNIKTSTLPFFCTSFYLKNLFGVPVWALLA